MYISTLAIGALLILAQFESQAQRTLNFSRYFDESVLPVLQREEFVHLPIVWEMPGNAQTFLNSGLTDLEEQNFSSATENFLQFTKLLPSSSTGHYYLGVSLKAQGRSNEAESALSEAVRLTPNCWQCEHELGNILLQNQKSKQAEKHFLRAIEINPKVADPYFSLGHLEMQNESRKAQALTATTGPSYVKAFRYYEKATTVDPSFSKGYVMQGLIKMPNMLRKKAALEFFDRAIAADSMSREGLFWRGVYYIYQNQPNEALKDWDKLVQYNPMVPRFVLLRGYLNVELERFDQAFTDLRKAALANEVNDEKFKGQQTSFDKLIDIQFATHYVMRSSYGLTSEALKYFKKGFCFLIAGRYQESLKELNMAENHEKAAVIYFTKAIVHEHSGNHPHALKYYDKAIEVDADIFDAYKKRSIYRTELKDWSGAFADYREMFRLQPRSNVTYKLRGFTKIRSGDYGGAIPDFTAYLGSDSTDAEVYLNRGFCHDVTNNCQSAAKDFIKSLTYDSLNGNLYEHTAAQLLKCGDSLEALRIRRWQVRTLRPTHSAKLWLVLAELELNLREYDEAQRHADEALRMIGRVTTDPLYARTIKIKGLSYYKSQMISEALNMFSLARKAEPNDLDIWYLKAICHMMLGDRRQALRDFDQLRKRPYKDSDKFYASLLGEDKNNR